MSFIRRLLVNFNRTCSRHCSTRNIDTEAPIKFTKSPASKWAASATRTGFPQPRLWYEPYVIMTSLSVFLIYFCVLREENDIDKELGRTLYSRIEGLEEHQLRASLKYNQEHGIDFTDIVNRLKEIEKEKLEPKM